MILTCELSLVIDLTIDPCPAKELFPADAMRSTIPEMTNKSESLTNRTQAQTLRVVTHDSVDNDESVQPAQPKSARGNQLPRMALHINIHVFYWPPLPV